MKETWNYKPIDLLKNARNGNSYEIDNLISKYAPFIVVNENLSLFLIFRAFNVHFWNGERRITNNHPENEYFQSGITVVRADDDGSYIESNIFLPNSLNVEALRISGFEIQIITDEKTILTNSNELFKKLKFFKLVLTEDEIQEGFNKLCNEYYKPAKQKEVERITIELPSFGVFIYDEKLKHYSRHIVIGLHQAELTIEYAPPHKLEKLISFADRQMQSKFYDAALLDMENEMVALKNDVWLEIDELSGYREKWIDVQEFRRRISIDSISFDGNGNSIIYCNDDGLFSGHQILIRLDSFGKYKDVTLAG